MATSKLQKLFDETRRFRPRPPLRGRLAVVAVARSRPSRRNAVGQPANPRLPSFLPPPSKSERPSRRLPHRILLPSPLLRASVLPRALPSSLPTRPFPKTASKPPTSLSPLLRQALSPSRLSRRPTLLPSTTSPTRSRPKPLPSFFPRPFPPPLPLPINQFKTAMSSLPHFTSVASSLPSRRRAL